MVVALSVNSIALMDKKKKQKHVLGEINILTLTLLLVTGSSKIYSWKKHLTDIVWKEKKKKKSHSL